MQLTVSLDRDSLVEIARAVGEELGHAPRYVSRDRLCAHMGITPRLLKTLRTRGLPAIKTGNVLFYDLERVERWIEEQA